MQAISISRLLVALLITCSSSIPVSARHAASDANLLANGDFESGQFAPWLGCGPPQLADAQAPGGTSSVVHGGRFALRIAPPHSGADCGRDALGPSLVVAEDVTVPSNANDVTISFWYSYTGSGFGDLWIDFASKPTSLLGETILVDQITPDELLPGWHLYRSNIKQADMLRLRGKTLYLRMYRYFSTNVDTPWAMHIDDVKVSASRERTQASPLPQSLRGDGQRPIVLGGPAVDGSNQAVFRMDTDGGNRLQLRADPLVNLLPTWSRDGSRIAFATGWVAPETNPLPQEQYRALIQRLHVMDANGANERVVFRGPGLAGEYEIPRGCFSTVCTTTPRTALESKLPRYTWLPSGELLISVCTNTSEQYSTGQGSRSDSSCAHQQSAIPQAQGVTLLTLPAVITASLGGDFNATGGTLFTGMGGISGRKAGVWERTTAETLLIPLTPNGGLDFRVGGDDDPTWLPDGRHFVTYRKSPSLRYVGDALRINTMIMLHDRQNLANPVMRLLVDHGSLSGRPSISPDGRYLLYTLIDDNNSAADIWWLDLANGDTGPVTRDGRSLNAHWNPTHRLPNPGTGGGSRRVFLPGIARGAVSTGGTPSPTPIVFASIPPEATPTPLPTPVNPTPVPPRGISGRITRNGAAPGITTLVLQSCSQILDVCSSVMTRTTDAGGAYAFELAPNLYLGALSPFHVIYINGPDGGNADDPNSLYYWRSFAITDFDFGERVRGGDFDIGNVTLAAPAAGNANLPVQFSWVARGIADESYEWLLNAPSASEGLGGTCKHGPLSSATTFNYDFAQFDSCDFLGTGGLEFNTPYAWYVGVVRSSGPNTGRGASSPQRSITFVP